MDRKKHLGFTPLYLLLHRKRFCEGFTLIELLVVISIIAILATIAISTFQGASRSARNTKLKVGLDTFAKVYETKYKLADSKYPDKDTITVSDFIAGEVPIADVTLSPDNTSFLTCVRLEGADQDVTSCSLTSPPDDCYCRASIFGTAPSSVTITTPQPTVTPGNTATPTSVPSPTLASSPTLAPTPTIHINPTSTPILYPTPTNAPTNTPTPTLSPTPVPPFTPVITTTLSCINAGYTGSGVTISWTNNANPVSYIDISTNIGFNPFFNRRVSTSPITAPNGFSSGTTALTLSPFPNTYYVRLWNDRAWSAVASFSIPACSGGSTPTPTSPVTPAPTSASARDPLKWPYASNSIWNMPVGSNAVYVPANLNPNPRNTIGGSNPWLPGLPVVDAEIIILKPTAPLTNIYYNSAAWTGRDRCPATGGLLTRVNMPTDFLIPNSTANNSAVFLNSDGRTLQQLQPVARCSAGSPATTLVTFPNDDIYGDGRQQGAHGGSGLSSFGGSIRMGELRPGQIGMKHALKVDVDVEEALYKCTTDANCYRWPAYWADSGAAGRYGTFNNNSNTAMKMGALLAIPASINVNTLGLETDPGRQLAWTLQNYGAYIVDDIYGPAFAFNLEVGPDGSKPDEFQRDYGYKFGPYWGWSNTPWQRDMQRLMRALYVVDNNNPTSIGGGGTPRQPLAPAIGQVAGIEYNNSVVQILSKIIILGESLISIIAR